MKAQLDEVITSFRVAALVHSNATLDGNYRVANKAAGRIHKLFLKLVNVGIEGREALLALAEEAEDQVAVMAATYSLRFDPERSLRVLERLQANRGILGFQADQAIKRWKSGEWSLE